MLDAVAHVDCNLFPRSEAQVTQLQQRLVLGMLRKRGFFFALYKRQKTKKPPESLAIKTF